MLHWLQATWAIVVAIAALSLWAIAVWVIVKFAQWKQHDNEQSRQDLEQQLIDAARNEPWKLDRHFWSKSRPSHTSSEPEALGDFYIDPKKCLNCGAAEAAPLLIRRHSTTHRCYFVKQPRTLEEVDQVVAAAHASCPCAIRYRGSEPDILVRLSPLSVDHPFRTRRSD